MKRWLVVFSVMVMMFISRGVLAGESETFNVIVSVAAQAGVSVSGGPIDFATMGLSQSSVSGSAVTVTNDGSGSRQTYSLQLTDPSGWTATTGTPGMNTYRLSAAFDADGNVNWNTANHALTTASVAATAVKFAGDQNGTGVAYGDSRSLYLKLETPGKTDSPGAKTIPVTVTAMVD